MTSNCTACADLKKVGAPFRCNHCRSNAPTAAETRVATVSRLVRLEGLTFEEAKARVDATFGA